jgi:hypothetical protein
VACFMALGSFPVIAADHDGDLADHHR